MSHSSTQKDRDCAFLARHALFPLQVNRDGTHQTLFPAVEALQTVRDAAIAANPDRVASSFFPRRVVVVRAKAGVDDGELSWNGQPDIVQQTASFNVIPQMLSVKCQECGKLQESYKKAFITTTTTTTTTQQQDGGSKQGETEIVLCTDRLLRPGDYSHGRIQDLPPKSLAAVEEVLAHEITRLFAVKPPEQASSNTHDVAAAAEILAARAAECYYGQDQDTKRVRKGSQLGPAGYSMFPSFLQNMLRDRCVRAVASQAVETKHKGEGPQSVAAVFEDVMSQFR